MGNQHGKLQIQNQSGRPKKNVHWKSAERPSPPGRPILIPLSDQQPDVVNLRWDRPKLDGGSPIVGYVVEHRRMGSPHWVRATPTPVPRCEVSISGLEPGWRYQFRVFAENVVGRSESSELSDALTVTLQRNAISVPRFTDELQDTQAVEDERIEFRVRVLGEPPPEISWFKDGYEIFSSRRTKIVNDNDVSVLVIHQVALTDEGEIKCTATNRAGHVVTKAKLLVQAPPKIRLPRAYEDGLIVEAEELLRLKVGIAGQPPPTITWLHEGEVLSGSRFEVVNTERNSMLKIDNIQRDDRGEYSVRATNKLGEDVASFLVTVTARPNPPGKVRLNMSFGRSATLSWTSPIDDGGCKIGNYIVEYYRVGWNVWLKAATTRSLSTTLHDLIEGSEYKFRVKAENPYGVSDPSEESDVLFIPDPKRGITKAKPGEADKPIPPRRKALSPARALQDAATEIARKSPRTDRKAKPQLLDTEDLHREMSYGTPDQVLNLDLRGSPSQTTSDLPTHSSPSQFGRDNAELSISDSKSPQHSPLPERSQFLSHILRKKDKSPSPSFTKTTPSVDASEDKDYRSRGLAANTELSKEVDKSSPSGRSPAPVSPKLLRTTPALQRSTEPVELGVNQHVRRYSGHALSPARNVPKLAIAIATSGLGDPVVPANEQSSLENPKIEISAPTSPPSASAPAPASQTPLTTPEIVSTPDSAVEANLPATLDPNLANADRQDDVHTSNEFMLVVFDKNSKVKNKDKRNSFELDLEDAIQPPPVSISAPDLALLDYSVLHTFPMRRSVSSTELLYERAMARFYEAVEFEEAEKARKLKLSQDKLVGSVNTQPTVMRKRLGSLTEAERLSFERRSELRRQSGDLAADFRGIHRWSSRENIADIKSISQTNSMALDKRPDSTESEELSEEYQNRAGPNREDSFELGSDYTESTASSDEDSIEKFKMELIARTQAPSPRELETYHPRNMSAGVFTPYRAPTRDEAALVLNRPVPLPRPDFIPKPILKRPSNEHVEQPDSNSNGGAVNAATEKNGATKGIKSFFKRDKRSTTEKNTEENQIVSNPQEKTNATIIAAETEAKRKMKEQEERRRREAQRIMEEESHAAVDHYSDLVQQVTSARKQHTPLYLDRDELKRAAEEATKEDLSDDDDTIAAEMLFCRSHSPEEDLIPPVSTRPRLSISERGQLMHVRETASDLAVREEKIIEVAETPSEDSAPLYPSAEQVPSGEDLSTSTTTTVLSESVEERPDSRGRPRLVKVKRVVRKRVPSKTRSRDGSQSRPSSGLSFTADNRKVPAEPVKPQAVAYPLRSTTAESKSPGPLGRKPLLPFVAPSAPTAGADVSSLATPHGVVVEKSAEQLSEEAHESVRSALSYSTDLTLFVVACYVYLFKDVRLVLPILALMIYRQIGEAINGCIPNWLKQNRK